MLVDSGSYGLLKNTFLKAVSRIANDDKGVLFNLNIYIDFQLQRGFKTLTSKQVEKKINQIAELFTHINEKDVFEVYYKNLLSKRLIYRKSLSDEMESQVIEKMKKECGFQYTKKIESMLKDFRLSLELNSDFHQQVEVFFNEDIHFQ